jgi:tetratricopeptide (TPR) repeat protein
MLVQENSATAIVNTADILLSAKAKYKNGDYEGSIAEYTLAIQFYGNMALAFCCRGDAYYKLGKEELAVADYDRAIELNPAMMIAYYRRGNVYFSAKNYALAIAEYTRAIELKSDFALAYLNRGYADRELYGEKEGIRDWQFAAKLFHDQGDAKQYKFVKDLIDLSTSVDTLSGML